MQHSYQDAYLKAQITEERHTRAASEVVAIGNFTSDWFARLVVLRAYMIVCLECQAQPDDLFAQKLKHYRQEWEQALPQAQAAAASSTGGKLQLFTIALERA